MRKNVIFLMIFGMVLGGLFANVAFAQNDSPKNLQKSRNNPANYRDKDGHELIFNIKGSQDTLVYLVIHYNDKLILKDSRYVSKFITALNINIRAGRALVDKCIRQYRCT